jgi:hypothetical protein
VDFTEITQRTLFVVNFKSRSIHDGFGRHIAHNINKIKAYSEIPKICDTMLNHDFLFGE